MTQRLRLMAMVLCATLCMGLIIPQPAHAAAGPTDTCTDFAKLYGTMSDGKPGILTNITEFIKKTIGTASQDLFQAFTSNSNYIDAVNAAITLMIVLYGVGFLIGIVQANFMQVLIRLIKVGLILEVISPSGWGFFTQYVVTFFNDGTDEIIGKVISIGTGTPYVTGSNTQFLQLDGIAKVMLSPDMVIAVLGSTLNGGPYGLMMGGLLAAAMWGLIKLFIHALKLYATSFVVRSLLIGVAPIFIVFLLFERTKQLFSGWVNVMVFLTLQPILLFTFLSFFIVMISTSTQTMMGGNELCWTEFGGAGGTQNKISFWRFKNPDGDLSVNEQTWHGDLSCYLNGGKTAAGKPCPSFPINIIDILSFLILIYVASKFSGVVDQIATEISNSFVNLDQGSKLGIENKNLNAEGKTGQGANPNASGATKPPPMAGTRPKGAGK